MPGKILLFIAVILLPLQSFCQSRINRYKKQERHGLWIIYKDSTNKVINNIGRYRKGIPKGTWKYYSEDGKLIRKEKYIFRKIYTNYYHPNGKVQKKGKAKIVINDTLLHYYYYGDWYVYDSTGTLIKKQVYQDGNKISEINFKSEDEKAINDSLVKVVVQLNSDIYKYSDSLIFLENKHGKDSKQYQRLLSISNLNAINIFEQIDRIILKFGYPGKTLVGNDYAIIFSIISTAALPYKEKYLDLIVDAANKKELDWTDVAYFVDKIKVAKKEKQIYGMQYKIGEHTINYYPIENKNKLNERRKSVGLDEEDIESYGDTATY